PSRSHIQPSAPSASASQKRCSVDQCTKCEVTSRQSAPWATASRSYCNDGAIPGTRLTTIAKATSSSEATGRRRVTFNIWQCEECIDCYGFSSKQNESPGQRVIDSASHQLHVGGFRVNNQIGIRLAGDPRDARLCSSVDLPNAPLQHLLPTPPE